MKGVAVTSLLLILGAFCSASSDDPYARECVSRMVSGLECFAPLEAAVSGMSFQEVLSAINNTDLSETCGVFTAIRDCVGMALHECRGHIEAEMPEDPRLQQEIEMMILYSDIIDYICVDHIDVFNENKGCLLRMSSGPFQVPQLLLDVQAQCEMPRPGPGTSFCIPTSYPDCAAGIVQQQCGAEIATAIRELDEQIVEVIGPCQERRLFRLMRKRQMKKKQIPPTFSPLMKKEMYSPQELMHKAFPSLF